MIWWIIILVNYTLFAPFTVSVNPYTDTVIINLTRRLSFRIKTTQHFLSVSSRANTCQLKCLYCLLVAWQYGTQELLFGMIITDPEHWRLRLKWRHYHGIIAQRTPPYNSHNVKRTWFVLDFDVIMQWVYWQVNMRNKQHASAEIWMWTGTNITYF